MTQFDKLQDEMNDNDNLIEMFHLHPEKNNPFKKAVLFEYWQALRRYILDDSTTVDDYFISTVTYKPSDIVEVEKVSDFLQ